MGLDIIHLIEHKTDGKWKLVRIRKPDGTYANPYCENVIIKDDIRNRNYEIGDSGFPDQCDSETKKLADDWGFSPRWVSLRTLQNLYRSKKELLKYKLREAYAELALEKLGGHSSENTYEPNYEWDDIKIRDRFDDIFECESAYLAGLNVIITKAEQFVDDALDLGYVNPDNVRIIFVCNN